MPISSLEPTRILLPGGAAFYPLVRTANALCSNSFIIRAASCVLVIDPGAESLHQGRLFDLLTHELLDGAKTVLFLITHCHRDHYVALNSLPTHLADCSFFMAQESGSRHLRDANGEMTLSYIFGEQAIPVETHLDLLGRNLLAGPGRKQVADGIVLEWRTEVLSADSARPIMIQKLLLAEGHELAIFHTPGHSPDSLCVQFDDRLFVGDLLFADKPGVAGIPGWSQEELEQSLTFIAKRIEAGGITWICPGHGPMMPAEQVAPLLRSALKNAARLHSLIRLDAGRITFLQESSTVLMNELSMQWAAMGGRLYLLAERLAELDEAAYGEELLRAVDLDAVDAFIADFHAYAEKYRNATLKIAVPLKGSDILSRIEQVLTDARVPQGVAPLFLRRVRLLMQDYINIMFGFDLRDFARPVDAVAVLHEVLTLFRPATVSLEEAETAAETPEAFVAFLARRLEARPLFAEVVAPEITDGASLPPVWIEIERLTLLLGDLLEVIAAAHPPRVTAQFRQDGDMLHLIISVEGADFQLSSQKQAYYGLMWRLLGGGFTFSSAQACATIALPIRFHFDQKEILHET